MQQADPSDPNASIDATTDLAASGAQAAAGLVVSLGTAQPPSLREGIPVLLPQVQAAPGANTGALQCTIAQGLSFTGNATLVGPCSVAGSVTGNLSQAEGRSVSVVVTETGEVRGDIRADKISVMGSVTGTLDASGGSVALLDSASVTGVVRYERIQVNGADLNATLERVARPGATRGRA